MVFETVKISFYFYQIQNYGLGSKTSIKSFKFQVVSVMHTTLTMTMNHVVN